MGELLDAIFAIPDLSDIVLHNLSNFELPALRACNRFFRTCVDQYIATQAALGHLRGPVRVTRNPFRLNSKSPESESIEANFDEDVNGDEDDEDELEIFELRSFVMNDQIFAFDGSIIKDDYICPAPHRIVVPLTLDRFQLHDFPPVDGKCHFSPLGKYRDRIIGFYRNSSDFGRNVSGGGCYPSPHGSVSGELNFNKLMSFDPNTSQLSVFSTTGQIPEFLSLDSMAIGIFENRLYMYGGTTCWFGRNRMLVLDFDTLVWVENVPPNAKRGRDVECDWVIEDSVSWPKFSFCTSFTYGHRWFVFSTNIEDEVWIFDFISNKWTIESINGHTIKESISWTVELGNGQFVLGCRTFQRNTFKLSNLYLFCAATCTCQRIEGFEITTHSRQNNFPIVRHVVDPNTREKSMDLVFLDPLVAYRLELAVK
eukprot:c6539_g1_i1.p1 GENE.c6539_g1_i1~~c6539_g1_i1.p1  ORF type:complete len:437 (+),score=113.89 c6539_g1_i1:35-1312(+)